MSYLFPNFLKDRLEYQICKRYWEAKIEYLFNKNKIVVFTPYLNTTFANGQEQYNGNPMINFYVEERNKALRIVQEEPETETVEISAWISETEINNRKTMELVICLELSPETELIALDFAEKWIVKNYTAHTLEKYIDFINETLTASKEEIKEKHCIV